ncbi:YfiR family protein [Pelagicoccus sp. SDUM812002]|uniref:YfiR family protein n=1 Tax=Pelagicoccus sp. SDUM812002 TaxID=3041266 RepID=UPI00280F8027|nr:YfiR family protein [Pelagicoccus sp. SDUM812002]MDQ8184892.1 YfiR family protein [Pelagicoccus sp. SDUM812002]
MNFFPRGIKATRFVACLLISMLGVNAFTQPIEQDTVEAAMTLQLLGFTEWPDKEPADESTPRTIGIMNSEPTYVAFKALLTDPRFAGRFAIDRVDSGTPNEALFSYDAIFFSDPDPREIPRIIKRLENRPIVLIGTFEDFLEQGGLVNIVKKQKRLGFEIHLDNSNRRGIEYRAKLLRLATRIVQE